jgi:hypothetical protein
MTTLRDGASTFDPAAIKRLIGVTTATAIVNFSHTKSYYSTRALIPRSKHRLIFVFFFVCDRLQNVLSLNRSITCRWPVVNGTQSNNGVNHLHKSAFSIVVCQIRWAHPPQIGPKICSVLELYAPLFACLCCKAPY